MSEATKLSLSAVYAKKAGMTRIFDESGKHIPVTVVQLIPNVISQVKTSEKDGYNAYQLAYSEKREKLVNKPAKGHLKKASIDKTFFKFSEIRSDEVSEENLGKEISIEAFAPQTFVDVTGTSKGKGFAGVMKRHNFQGGPGAHGSKFHRTTGSIGNRATPGRVFAQKKMPGHMGNDRVTVLNLKVLQVDAEKNLLLLGGAVPGSAGGYVVIRKAVAPKPAQTQQAKPAKKGKK